MPQKSNYQKILFTFLAAVSLVSLQGCGTSTTETDAVVTGKTYNDVAMSGDTMNTGAHTNTGKTVPQKTGSTIAQPQAGLNGTFHLKAEYNSPAGKEPMDATVTIKNDVVTAVSAENVAINATSQRFQQMFIGGISGQIVGKNIKDVKVTYVNGSSLTAEAFDKALHALQK